MSLGPLSTDLEASEVRQICTIKLRNPSSEVLDLIREDAAILGTMFVSYVTIMYNPDFPIE